MRGIDHRVLALVEAAHRLLAAEHQAGHGVSSSKCCDSFWSMLTPPGSAGRAAGWRRTGCCRCTSRGRRRRAGCSRPLMTLSFSLKGASDVRLEPSSIAAPSPFDHQCVRRDAVAHEQAGEPLRRLGCGRDGVAAEEIHGFQPGQAQWCSPGPGASFGARFSSEQSRFLSWRIVLRIEPACSRVPR